jgi:hypothetical protein
MTWEVIGSHEPPDVIPEFERRDYGLKGFKLENFNKRIFLISFRSNVKDKRERVAQMSEAIPSSKVKCKTFTDKKEFLTNLGTLKGAAEFCMRGSDFLV